MFLCIYIDCDWSGHAIQRTVIGLIHPIQRLSPFHHVQSGHETTLVHLGPDLASKSVNIAVSRSLPISISLPSLDITIYIIAADSYHIKLTKRKSICVLINHRKLQCRYNR